MTWLRARQAHESQSGFLIGCSWHPSLARRRPYLVGGIGVSGQDGDTKKKFFNHFMQAFGVWNAHSSEREAGVRRGDQGRER
jgi:hypothetical protein